MNGRSSKLRTEIATRLDVPEVDVTNMNRRLSSSDQSLNATVRSDGDSEWIDWLVEETPDQEVVYGDTQMLNQRRELLEQAMAILSERDRDILDERRLKDDPSTLEDLSKKYGISRERVRQIEIRAFEKVQKSMKNAAIEQRVGY